MTFLRRVRCVLISVAKYSSRNLSYTSLFVGESVDVGETLVSEALVSEALVGEAVVVGEALDVGETDGDETLIGELEFIIDCAETAIGENRRG